MKVLVAVPCMDSVPTLFLASMVQLQHVADVEISLTQSSLIYDARNALAHKAIQDNFDRVLWLDSDIIFQPDLMQRLSARIDQGYEFVTGLYFTRKEPIKPVVYKDVGIRENIPFCDSYTDYPDDIFEIAGSGMGGVMMTTALIREVAEKFGLPFSPMLGFGEDLSFCNKVRELGKKMYCDPSIKLGHLGGKIYGEADFALKGVKQWNV